MRLFPCGAHYEDITDVNLQVIRTSTLKRRYRREQTPFIIEPNLHAETLWWEGETKAVIMRRQRLAQLRHDTALRSGMRRFLDPGVAA